MNIRSKHMQEKEPSAATQEKQSRQTDEPVLPKIKWNKDSIELNDKVHRLPITKDYILKEFSDVFKGVGTLPGGPYHIRLKDDYKPSTTSTEISTHSHATCIQSRVRETN